MARYVFDLEADGLLKEATRMWILVAKDLDTGKVYECLEGDLSWKDTFDKAELIVGHNIEGYDIPLLKKLFGYELPNTVKRHDTLILSQVLDYRRFGYLGHSLAVWGDHLGFPKVVHEDWSQYSEEMRNRCITDVNLNVKVYVELIDEYRKLSTRSPLITEYLRAEHAVARWQALAQLHGWPFDVEGGYELMVKLEDEMEKAHSVLDARLGTKAVAVDMCKGIAAAKKPVWTKLGCYNAHTANWFGIDPWNGFEGEERLVEGPYCRVTFEPLKLSSPSDMKIFLYRQGWEPTEWNTKKDPVTGDYKNTSPKITDDSLEFLKGDGQLYRDYASAVSRYSILQTWLSNVDWNGNLHGDSMTIGTPSMRTRHQIIVNVPSPESLYGPEMRKLFICRPKWKLIGCDSSGNQARGLAYYLGDEEFIDVILHKDVHIYNATKLIDVLNKMGIEHDFTPKTLRPKAKRILYAFLFGASGKKLWGYLFGIQDTAKGNKLKKGFTEAVPGFKALLDQLGNIYGKTSQDGYGYIPSLAGNKIYVDSFHKLLVYLLQSAEKITCSAAVMLTMEGLEAANIPYIPLIVMHDEEDFMVPEEYAEEAKEIGIKAFHDGPKIFGIDIMAGEGKIGDNWLEIH